jgi:hypothetical protein
LRQVIGSLLSDDEEGDQDLIFVDAELIVPEEAVDLLIHLDRLYKKQRASLLKLQDHPHEVNSVKKLGGELRTGRFGNDKHVLNEKHWHNSDERHDKVKISSGYN